MRRLIRCLNRNGTCRETDPMDRKGTGNEIKRFYRSDVDRPCNRSWRLGTN